MHYHTSSFYKLVGAYLVPLDRYVTVDIVIWLQITEALVRLPSDATQTMFTHMLLTVPIFVNLSLQYSEEYRKVNPKCELPALQIDNVTLTQSLPIMEYLEETRPSVGCSLLPKDPVKRAIVRKLSEIINSGIQPLQNLSVMRYLPPDISRDQWAAHWIQRGFKALEAELQKVSGNYCVGDELSMADICLVPQVYNAHR
ncbi:hypothetical protein AHF37_08900 [Paragonimus kellicotti]|nr:hypothetical protein AHF37_08900 [Paragonimus kellicotti]